MRLDDVRICENLFLKVRKKVVNIAPAPCFLADFYRVKTEPSGIVLYHSDGGMTAPPGGLALQGVEDLIALDPLFHKPLSVEHAGALFDVGIWEEDLHLLYPIFYLVSIIPKLNGCFSTITSRCFLTTVRARYNALKIVTTFFYS
jgi:hypothetical protein